MILYQNFSKFHDFIQKLFTKNEKKLASYFIYRYRYDVLLINNSKFGDKTERIYHNEFKIKDTTEYSYVYKLTMRVS